jgi:hypothetical protein
MTSLKSHSLECQILVVTRDISKVGNLYLDRRNNFVDCKKKSMPGANSVFSFLLVAINN